MALHKDVRRRRALEAFERRLEQASPDEIRAMLAQRRIRSPERIELAEARLRRHEEAAAGTGSRPGGDGHDHGRRSRTPRATAGEEREMPLTRRVGRVLGIGLGIASLAALAVFGSRR